MLTAQTAQSLKLPLSGPIAIILGVINRSVLHPGGTTWTQGVHSDPRWETAAVTRGQAVESSHAVLSHLTFIRAHLRSLLDPSCCATTMQRHPASFRQPHTGPFPREGHGAGSPPVTLTARFHCVVLLRQPGWWQEQVVSSGTGSTPSTSTCFTVFKLRCRCFVATQSR